MALSRHPLSPSSKSLGKIPIDRGTMALLASSFRVIEERGAEFTDKFYAKLFAAHPHLRPMFPADMAAQKAKLLDMLETVFSHLADPQANQQRLEELGKRHKGYGACPHHYPEVTQAMLAAMSEVAGSDWNPAIQAEWRRALALVSEVMLRAAGQGLPS
jgi:hemoglobin-like flavoprotein